MSIAAGPEKPKWVNNNELRRLTSLFLDRKEFSGAGGFVVDDRIALSVAVQACLPVLELGIEQYDAVLRPKLIEAGVRQS